MAILTGMMWCPIVELPELINKFNKVSGCKTNVQKCVVYTSNEMSSKESLKISCKIILKNKIFRNKPDLGTERFVCQKNKELIKKIEYDAKK